MPNYSTYSNEALAAERDALRHWLQTVDAPAFQVTGTRKKLREIEAEMSERGVDEVAVPDARYSTTHHDGKVHLINDPREIARYVEALHRYHDGLLGTQPMGFAHHIDRPLATELAREVQAERRADGKPYREIWMPITWHGDEANIESYRQRGLKA